MSVKSHTKFIVGAGGVFKGSRQPTHVHSDFIVLDGGRILCDKNGALGDFARVWVKKGGKVDTDCLRGYARQAACTCARTTHHVHVCAHQMAPPPLRPEPRSSGVPPAHDAR